jgi:glycosyltransferase involved in cell wall biosynthesis
MHIAIDITPLETGHNGRGVGVYTKNLVEALQKFETSHSYSFITRTQKVHNNVDLIHYPYFDPFFLTLPLLKPKPTVVTVHDLIPLVFPDKFPTGLRGRIKWLIQKYSLRGARRIITDSKSSKTDIQTITGIDSRYIDVVYLAPHADYHVTTDSTAARRRVEAKYKLPKRFIIYAGDVNWNKNIFGLLSAFSLVSGSREFDDASLVLVGKSFFSSDLAETKVINTIIGKSHLENKVIRTGFVPEEDLAILYGMAACLVQPSWYEGFGLPVLEAMACGCPVIVADNSSLSEIAGPSLRVHAGKYEDIARGMKIALQFSAADRKKIISQGLEWVKTFTWQKVARETVASYEKVVSRI